MARTLAFGVEHDGEGRGYDNQGPYRKRTWRGISSGSEGHSGCNDATGSDKGNGKGILVQDGGGSIRYEHRLGSDSD